MRFVDRAGTLLDEPPRQIGIVGVVRFAKSSRQAFEGTPAGTRPADNFIQEQG